MAVSGSTTPTDNLKPKQKRAIAALLNAASFEHAAKQAGVSPRTLYRWLAEDEAFVRKLHEAQDMAIDTAASLLAGISHEAVSTLREIQRDASTPASVRVQAAGRLLSILLDIRTNRDLAERVAALEAKEDARTENKTGSYRAATNAGPSAFRSLS